MGFSTNVEIANLALSHLGSTKELTDFTSGTTTEDKAINRFFVLSREQMLREHWWSFAKKVASLAGKSADPNTFWAYSYTYPTDCLQVRRIRWDTVKPARIDHDTSVIDYFVDKNAGLIYTDRDDAVIEYTEAITDITKVSTEFGMALSYLLAYRCAPSLTGGDPFKLMEKMYQLYQMEMGKARSLDLQEERTGFQHESEFIRRRGIDVIDY